jgi:hypothetical protein
MNSKAGMKNLNPHQPTGIVTVRGPAPSGESCAKTAALVPRIKDKDDEAGPVTQMP